jgi:hypothetical protein
MLPLLSRKLFEMRDAAGRGERAAARHWHESDGTVDTHAASVAIRRATDADCARLLELALLDEVELPDGPFLVAEEAGEIEAALPLSAGRPFSDPFRPTRELLEMLDLRAAQLGVATAGRRHA